MSNSVINWVAEKLVTTEELEIVERTPEDFLVVRAQDGYTFLVAVLGVQNVIELSDVEPLFAGTTKPQFIVNVPSKTLWSGAAIDRIHAESAAFGTLGDVSRAANTENAGSFRDKNMGFFINAMEQHSNVSSISYVYGTVFKVDRKIGESLVVAVIDAYNMSAEDVRNAKSRFGDFDVLVKSSSYGSITNQAEAAAKSMGAQTLTFRQLMGRLGN
ncbi:hypothetical protein CFN79_09370 [Chromobacterium vaccinii]|uniref:hypothetical protein n=1 Tax=Chromobacterium vaccinii TaxID=1108595 RepID=UPI000CE9AB26|nr:hypothetical protein [Chromobacterium vaccinii]AVG16045.1 hypothetical protein CFN79_09370 [Chromobacterium vaccinii]